MSKRLHELINPLQLAAEGQLLTGRLALSGMQRLAPILANPRGTVDVELEFGQDGQNVKYLRGHIHADLELVCQRCLQAMAFSIDAEPCLGIVTSRLQAERLPERYEPLLLEAEFVPLATIIEDELILGLPAIPKHDDENCLDFKKFSNSEPETEAPRINPFSVLSKLKDYK